MYGLLLTHRLATLLQNPRPHPDGCAFVPYGLLIGSDRMIVEGA